MFPCTPHMVTDVKDAIEKKNPELIEKYCIKLRNACLGSPKRKERFVSFGVIPVLLDLITTQPEHSKEALTILGSLISTESTFKHAAENASNCLWNLVFYPPSAEIADGAARVLRSIVLYHPENLIHFPNHETRLLKMINSNTRSISRLGVRCVISHCQSNHSNGNSPDLSESKSIMDTIATNRFRSDEDLLALATLYWKNGESQKIEQSSLTWSRPTKRTALESLYEFWCRIYEDVAVVDRLECPPPRDALHSRKDGEHVLKWVLETLLTSSKTRTPVEQRDISKLNLITPLLGSDITAIRNEATVALTVFCAVSISRQSLCTLCVPALVDNLVDSDPTFSLAALLILTASFQDPIEGVRANHRQVLSRLIANEVVMKRLKQILRETSDPCFNGSIQLIHHLSTCEEAIVQLTELKLYIPLLDHVPGNYTALACLSNLAALSEEVVGFICGNPSFLQSVSTFAIETKSGVAWSLLTNITATKSKENKAKFVECIGTSFPMLLSEQGLPVIGNICVGGIDHAELVEDLIPAALTLVASGLEPSCSLELPMLFLANVAASSETARTTICNDHRLLQMMLRALDSSSSTARLSTLRCLVNLLWASPESRDDQQQQPSSPRTHMLRVVQARMVAAASRSPIRFTPGRTISSGSITATSGLAHRQSKIESAGFLPKIVSLSEEGSEDESLRQIAQEVLQALALI